MPFGGWQASKIYIGEMENLLKSKPANQLSQLVTVWCEHHKTPCETTRDLLTEYLNEQIQRQVPLDRFMGTILQGHEAIVRQDALIMLSGGFLLGNKQLLQATAIDDFDLVADQIMRSLAAAIRFVRLRVRRKIVDEQRRMLPLIGDVHSSGGPVLESDTQDLKAIESTLKRALREHRLTLLDQKLAIAVICDGENYKKVSRRLGISKSQGYRRLKRAVKVLQQMISKDY